MLGHSFGTYRLPILKSADALALEMGNSPAVIFRHYRRPTTEVAAQKYFELLPSKPAQPIDGAKTQDRPADEGILEEPSEGWSKRVAA